MSLKNWIQRELRYGQFFKTFISEVTHPNSGTYSGNCCDSIQETSSSKQRASYCIQNRQAQVNFGNLFIKWAFSNRKYIFEWVMCYFQMPNHQRFILFSIQIDSCELKRIKTTTSGIKIPELRYSSPRAFVHASQLIDNRNVFIYKSNENLFDMLVLEFIR